METSVIFVDSFGNARLAGAPEDLVLLRGALDRGDRFRLAAGDATVELPWTDTFGDVEVGAPLLYHDADYDGLAVGINQGSAAERLGLSVDLAVRIEPF
jgi:S-adenosylmethionine hydrolase